MINRNSAIKTLAIIVSISGLSVACGPNVEMVKKQAQEEVQAKFDAEKAKINSEKEKLQKQLDDSDSQLAEKDEKIKELKAKLIKAAQLQGEETDNGFKLTLGAGWFKSGKADLVKQAGSQLENLAKFLKYSTTSTVLIVGHTDNRGDEEKNQELSEQRAKAVAAALVDLGVAEDRIETKGVGSSEPIADNNTAKGRKQNRRVEITILN